MRKYLCLFVLPLLTTACTTPQNPATCWGKIEIGRHIYDQPIYKQRDGFYMKEYLVGDAFKYTWVEKNKFKDLSDCKDKFK
ncbi:phage exclusion lipoprotein Cor [Pectobacterium sp. A5351]|uniref:phage exclusion lipoprotein Cor n=1 Tax=Pectobacterium sp. A5351 TaxID=2914983 RepID=UPI003FA6BAEA